MVILWYYNGIIIGGTREKNWKMDNLKKHRKTPFLLVSALCNNVKLRQSSNYI